MNPERPIDPPEAAPAMTCPGCGTELYEFDHIYELHGEYLCAECYCYEVLSEDKCNAFLCTQEKTDRLCETLGDSVYMAYELKGAVL